MPGHELTAQRAPARAWGVFLGSACVGQYSNFPHRHTVHTALHTSPIATSPTTDPLHPLRLLFGRRISRQPLHPEPVFILGHPRTGTTHLHNLLALDPAFAFCNTFHAGEKAAPVDGS